MISARGSITKCVEKSEKRLRNIQMLDFSGTGSENRLGELEISENLMEVWSPHVLAENLLDRKKELNLAFTSFRLERGV